MAKVHHDRLTHPDPMSALENAAFQCESAKELVRAFECGLDNQADILGWHGTSIEALARALRLGALSCSPVEHAKAPADSSIFYFPANLEQDFAPRVPGGYDMSGRPGAEHYAKNTAQIHFAMRTLGLDFSDPLHHRAVRAGLMHVESWDSEGEDALKVLAKHGVSEATFRDVAKEAFKQRGVLLALSIKHTAEFSIVDGDEPGWDKRVVAPGGLPLIAINGLEPLGEKEYGFFEKLQDSLTQGR